MTGTLLLFGPGYTGLRIADAFRRAGFAVTTVRRRGDGRSIGIDEPAVPAAIAAATHIASCVPPPAGEHDPVLDTFAARLQGRWLGYLSSTGVYGDTGGAWVDEGAPIGGGRRTARMAADAAWLAAGARVFRLPGIYGPGRSPLDRLRDGRAHRIDLPDQVFSRVHVEDIVTGVMLGLDAPAGAYNLADDCPASQNAVVEEAARLLGVAPPPLVTLDEAGLSPMGRGFYAENRRVANGKAKRVLGWRPRYPDYRAGLGALSAMSSPSSVNPAATPD